MVSWKPNWLMKVIKLPEVIFVNSDVCMLIMERNNEVLLEMHVWVFFCFFVVSCGNAANLFTHSPK